MKRIFTSPVKWILGLAVIAFVSYLTGLSFWWCLLAYLGVIFLVEFAKNMSVVILGIIMVIGLSLALFFGLLTL